MVPLATAAAGPVESLVGRSEALWGCAALIVLVTAGVLLVPDVRNLTRRSTVKGAAVPAPARESSDAEGAVGRLG